MKFYKPIVFIIYLVLMTIVWCMDPPGFSLPAKILYTFFIIGGSIAGLLSKHLRSRSKTYNVICRSFSHWLEAIRRFGRACIKALARFLRLIISPFIALQRLISKLLTSTQAYGFRQTCREKISQFGTFIDECSSKFASWSFQADLNLLEERRCAILEELGHDKRPPSPPLPHQILVQCYQLFLLYHHTHRQPCATLSSNFANHPLSFQSRSLQSAPHYHFPFYHLQRLQYEHQ